MASVQGIAQIDFGAVPGTSYATVSVANATVLDTGSAEAWIRPQDATTGGTGGHNVDEHKVVQLLLDVVAGKIASGVGFPITGCVRNGRLYGLWNLNWCYSDT